jgi:hypothetical protein
MVVSDFSDPSVDGRSLARVVARVLGRERVELGS